MMQVGVHIVVGSSDGSTICEVNSTTRIIPRDTKDASAEVAQTDERLTELVGAALDDIKSQLLDFSKIVGGT